MKKIDMGPVFRRAVQLHIGLAGKDGDVVIENVNILLRVADQAVGTPCITGHNDQRGEKAPRGKERGQPHLAFNIFNNHYYWV